VRPASTAVGKVGDSARALRPGDEPASSGAVVDDSESVRESLPDLLQQVGWSVQAFESAEGFLASNVADRTVRLILDVGLPGMNGLDLQQELTRLGKAIPIVFITGQETRPSISVSWPPGLALSLQAVQ
jgi:DNA-binding NtrC family response regulator